MLMWLCVLSLSACMLELTCMQICAMCFMLIRLFCLKAYSSLDSSKLFGKVMVLPQPLFITLFSSINHYRRCTLSSFFSCLVLVYDSCWTSLDWLLASSMQLSSLNPIEAFWFLSFLLFRLKIHSHSSVLSLLKIA